MSEEKRVREESICEESVRKESICEENVRDGIARGEDPREEAADKTLAGIDSSDEAEVDMSWFIEALMEAARERDYRPEEDTALGDAPEPLGMVIPSDPLRAYGKPGYYGRAVERIDPFLEELGKFWKKHPDWRFGQLMCNLDRCYRAQHNGCDFFYLEEDEFLAFLQDCEG